jgi:hypothetical protein
VAVGLRAVHSIASERIRDWAWGVLAAATLTAVYVSAYGDLVGRFFAFDDFAVLEAADAIRVEGPSDMVRFLVPWQTFAQYRPLTTVAYFSASRALFGLDPTRWTMVQLGFHVLNALLVYAVARRLLDSRPGGYAVALIYASAPGHAPAVRWLAYFTITGTALACLFGLWVWLRASERWRGAATLAVFVVALLCSEHAVSFPAAVTAVAVLAQGRRDWRRLGRELGPLWVIGAAYLAAKLVFVYVLYPRWAPLQAAVFRAAYALSFDPFAACETLGRFVAATVGPLWAADRSTGWYRITGGATLGLTAAAVAAAWTAGRRRPWLGNAACGLVLFAVGLAPVVFLPQHVAIAYVGLAAYGVALAIVAPLRALPHGGAIAVAVAVLLVGVHLRSTATAIRSTHDFRVVEVTSQRAVGWLQAIAAAAGPDTREVVVPTTEVTWRMFGVAHRMFLCATYDVRLVETTQGVPASPGRVVIPQSAVPSRAGPSDWRSVVRDCPDGSEGR